jgi:hypothetical protein
LGLSINRARELLTREGLAVISTAGPDGAPESALVNIGVAENLDLIFETIETTRKCLNLRRGPRASIVVWEDNETLQYSGIADEPDEFALEPLLRIYFDARSEARGHRGWPGLTYFRIRPKWLRLSAYYGTSWKVDELTL